MNEVEFLATKLGLKGCTAKSIDMKIERNIIIEATESELMEHYLQEGYDDIYSFREYLRLMVEAGVKIVEE